MQNVHVKLDLVYTNKPKEANIPLFFASHACRRARRISDADGRLPYMGSPMRKTLAPSASCYTVSARYRDFGKLRH